LFFFRRGRGGGAQTCSSTLGNIILYMHTLEFLGIREINLRGVHMYEPINNSGRLPSTTPQKQRKWLPYTTAKLCLTNQYFSHTGNYIYNWNFWYMYNCRSIETVIYCSPTLNSHILFLCLYNHQYPITVFILTVSYA
jgi:hypothetical protein